MMIPHNLLSTTDPGTHTTWTDCGALNRAITIVRANGSGPGGTCYATTTGCATTK